MIKNIRQRPDDFDDLDPEELVMLGPGPFLSPGVVCTYCGDEFPFEVIEKDHVIPISRGGRDVKAIEDGYCPDLVCDICVIKEEFRGGTD